ncbi:iron chelate uptake ABC transporter family permease subunit [Escherichia coli]
MQTLTRNPLAHPASLGVNAGASFAIAGVRRCLVTICAGTTGDGLRRALVASLIVVAFTGSQGRAAVKSGAFNPGGRGAGPAVLEGLTSGIACPTRR